jgi:hypothetical protein
MSSASALRAGEIAGVSPSGGPLSRVRLRAGPQASSLWACHETRQRSPAQADLASFDGTMDLSGRGRGLFDAILRPHTEGDVDSGLEAAED